jgi:hypothetical protein
MTKYIFTAIIVFLLISCRQKREEIFHIKAINPVTMLPYAGLEWGVSATKTGYDGEKQVYEKSGVLDANGEAWLTLKVKEGRTYNIGCIKPANTCYVKQIKFTYAVQDPAKPTFLFEFAPCAILKLKIKNISCSGPADYFKLTFLGTEVDPTYFNGATIKEEYGCYELESDFSNVPMGERYYKWEVTKNGFTNTYFDTVDLAAGETRIFQINY